MTLEDKYEELDIVLDRNGQVDVEYYYEKARDMQSQAMKEMFSAISKGFGNWLHAIHEKYLSPGRSSAH